MKSTILITVLGVILMMGCSSSRTAEQNPGYPGPTAPSNVPPNGPGAQPATFPNGAAGGYEDIQLRTMASTLDSAIDQLQKDATQVEPSLSANVIAKLQSLHQSSTDLLEHADQGVKEGNETNPHFKELVKAYYEAKQQSPAIQDTKVQQDFDRVTGLMKQMSQYFNYPFDPDKLQEPGTK